jgi:hypothetical protein
MLAALPGHTQFFVGLIALLSAVFRYGSPKRVYAKFSRDFPDDKGGNRLALRAVRYGFVGTSSARVLASSPRKWHEMRQQKGKFGGRLHCVPLGQAKPQPHEEFFGLSSIRAVDWIGI